MLYDIGFFVFSIFYLPTLLFKGKLHGNFSERFGLYSAEKKKALGSAKGKIWIQAVSVGEVSACKSLIPLLRERFPDKEIVLSTITRTGNTLAKKLFSLLFCVVFFKHIKVGRRFLYIIVLYLLNRANKMPADNAAHALFIHYVAEIEPHIRVLIRK